MTCIVLSAGRCDIMVAGGETQWKPRNEIEHIFQRRRKHLSKEVFLTSSQLLHATFTYLPKSIISKNSAAAEEMGSSSEELAGQVEFLKEAISFFNTDMELNRQSIKKGKGQMSYQKPHHNLNSRMAYKGVALEIEMGDKDPLFEKYQAG